MAKLTGNKEAIKISNFVKKHGRISLPILQGIRPLEDTTGGEWFSIVLLSPGDDRISVEWNQMFHANSVAMYHNGIKAMVLRSNPVGPLCRSLTIIHEGKHVMDDMKEFGREYGGKRDSIQLGIEERDVYNLIHKLMLKVGGKDYQKLLLQKSEERYLYMKENKIPLDRNFDPDMRIKPELELIFGPFISEYERNVWQLSFEIHIFFTLAEKYHQDPERLKMEFFMDVYRSEGLL